MELVKRVSKTIAKSKWLLSRRCSALVSRTAAVVWSLTRWLTQSVSIPVQVIEICQSINAGGYYVKCAWLITDWSESVRKSGLAALKCVLGLT